MQICHYGCGRQASYQMKNGKWCCSKSPNSCEGMRKKNSEGLAARRLTGKKKKSSRGMLGKVPWNKGITAKDDIRIEASRSKISKSLLGHSHKQSQRTREKISSTMKRNKCGGLRKGSGRGRKGYYNKIWCDSTWELAYVLYNIDHGIEFKRNKNGFEYVYNNKKHRYYPDFVLPDNTYIEIKGYYTKQTISKMNQFSKIHKLIVLDKVGI